MKLGLISTAFVTACIIGCAAHKAVPPVASLATPLTAQPVTPPAPPAPLPMLPGPDAGTVAEDAGPVVKNNPPDSNDHKLTYESDLSEDGTTVNVKGMDWEFRVPLNQGWRPVPLPVEFAMYNRNSHALVMVRHLPNITSVAALHNAQLEEFKQTGGTVVPGSLKTVNVNGTPAKTWRGNIKGGLFQEWEFLMLGQDPSTGSGLIFNCGGPKTEKVCTEIAKSFYIGRAPAAP